MCELLCVVVKLVLLLCCSLVNRVCPVCSVGGGGVGMRIDLSGGLTSFAFLDAGSKSIEDAAVLVGSGR